MIEDVLAGLSATPRQLPCRLLWDARGAELFDQICTLDEYYLTRHELGLLREHLPAIARTVGPRARVIEPGSGVAHKTRLLLDALATPASYVAIELEAEQLAAATAALRVAYPELDVQPVCADYMRPFELPATTRPFGRSLVFFPGSTIGNFEPFDAIVFLAGLQRIAGPDGRLLLGADGTQDPIALVRAYDDLDGVTARFDLNILDHLNRTRGARFDLSTFRHRAVWNQRHSRVEMHLVSQVDQQVDIGGDVIALAKGEPIVTEHCYKHSMQGLRSMLQAAGWDVEQVLTGKEQPMRLWWCTSLTRLTRARGDLAL